MGSANVSDAGLDALQHHAFNYYLRETNDVNGLVDEDARTGWSVRTINRRDRAVRPARYARSLRLAQPGSVSIPRLFQASAGIQHAFRMLNVFHWVRALPILNSKNEAK